MQALWSGQESAVAAPRPAGSRSVVHLMACEPSDVVRSTTLAAPAWPAVPDTPAPGPLSNAATQQVVEVGQSRAPKELTAAGCGTATQRGDEADERDQRWLAADDRSDKALSRSLTGDRPDGARRRRQRNERPVIRAGSPRNHSGAVGGAAQPTGALPRARQPSDRRQPCRSRFLGERRAGELEDLRCRRRGRGNSPGELTRTAVPAGDGSEAGQTRPCQREVPLLSPITRSRRERRPMLSWRRRTARADFRLRFPCGSGSRTAPHQPVRTTRRSSTTGPRA